MTDSYHMLSNKWVLWFHDPSDTEWGLNSYMNVFEFDSIELFWHLFNNIDKQTITQGMFFIMKKDIVPLWEDKKNENGGCWSYRIQKKNAHDAWINLAMALCGNHLTDEKYIKSINGISISPKKSFCIIKIWNNDSSINNIKIINKIDKLDNSDSIYRAHKDRSY